MNNSGSFHVTKERPLEKMGIILTIEATCPVCNSEKTCYQTQHRLNNKLWQNFYSCDECFSEWVGNTYDESYTPISPKQEEEMSLVPNPFFQALAYLFAL